MLVFQYKATDYVVQSEGTLELVFTPASGGQPVKLPVFTFKKGGGVGLAMYNTDEVGQLPDNWLFFAVI